MIGRGAFLGGIASVFATGGLEPTPTPSPSPAPGTPPAVVASGSTVRVLVGTATDVPRTLDGGTFWFGGKRWRGIPSVATLADGRSVVIATVDVDAYLAGVVPLEASPGWPPGALAAQTIVARTYALARRNVTRPYDLVNGDADQRWGGVDAEHPVATAAVTATRGKTLTYLGGPASVFYSACCGGHTEDAASMWGRTALPYLRGVADPHCTFAPDYRWRRDVGADRVVAALGADAARLGPLSGFELSDPDGGGRPRTLAVIGQTGRLAVPTVTFRTKIGAETVRSAWLTAVSLDTSQAPARVTIEGAGRGHGVGLCQWGALGMARDGADGAAILAFYFPGTTVSG